MVITQARFWVELLMFAVLLYLLPCPFAPAIQTET